jgi:hypothetical protein
MRKGTDVLLNGHDNEIERLSLGNGKLNVEIFTPASTYPQKASVTGYGERTK